jgi:CubicO group peptidase (beta-lactamase class C family)
MTMPIDVQGTCEPRFKKVQEAFVQNFEEREEVGAAVALTVDGEMVVDIWAGDADETGRPWERDTLVNVFSTSKGMTATCAHILADRGELDIDAPVATYWPEFAQAGKQDIPVRWLLSHRSGVFGTAETLPTGAIFDWDRVCDALAATPPFWEPGTRSGYHAISFGFLVGEVVRRISGVSLGTFLQREVCEPLGAELYIGTPESELSRCADLVGSIIPELPADSGIDIVEATGALFNDPTFDGNPFEIAFLRMGMPNDMNSPEWRMCEMPAVNGQMSARGLATVYGALANGGEYQGTRIIGEQAIDVMREPQPEGTDLILSVMTGQPMSWRLGFLPNIDRASGPNPLAFGHGGAGGSYTFADPENRVSYAYVMNKLAMSTTGNDERSMALVGAVYDALDD